MILRVTSVLAVLLITAEARKHVEHENQWQEFEEFLKWKKGKQAESEEREMLQIIDSSEEMQNPPPVDQGALMARYIVNQADWAAVATISTRKEVQSYPVANLISVSDGTIGTGAGIPYMYLTPRDFTAQDLARDNRATLLMSLAQGSYCKGKDWDPMDPRCARVLLTGKIKTLKNGTREHDVAKDAFFNRHPKLVNMPADHHFFFAKLKIQSIAVLDTFGGPKYVSVKDYLNPPVANVTAEFLRLFPLKQTPDESQESYESNNFLNPNVQRV